MKLALLADAGHVNCQVWCEGLSNAGAEVHLMSFARSTTKTAAHTYRLSVPKLPAKLHYFAAAPEVRRLLRTIQPDVLAAYYVTGYGTLGALAGFHPLVQITSGSDVLLAPRNPLMRNLLRYNLHRADLVTAWAPHMADRAEELGVSANRILVLPRGIPSGRFGSARSSVPAGAGLIRIISTRALNRDYNFDLLLSTVKRLRIAHVPVTLTLAGDGPDRSQVAARIRALGLEHKVRFAGFVPNEELPELLAQNDIYISLIDSDGVSASLLEAMAVGLLPIVPENSANRFWIRSGENGVLLNDLSPSAIADAVARAGCDVELRRRAWHENLGIVRDRADLESNSRVFVEQFRRLATDYRN